MKNLLYIFLIFTGLFISACEIEEIQDPNSPGLEDFEDATYGEILLLVSGTEHALRNEMGFYYDVLGIMGREYYFFTNSDPRYTGEVLGKGQSVLDDRGFYGTRPYAGRYKAVKNANILIDAVQNTREPFSDAEKNGIIGLAKTFKAYSLLLVANMQYQNGVRIDVTDPENLGPFVDYDASLTQIASILDDAYNDLTSAGDELIVPLSSTFPYIYESADNPKTLESLQKFNRAIRARVAIYQDDKTAALDALDDSFMDLNGDLDTGPAHFFSTVAGDMTNPLVRELNGTGDVLVAHPSYIADIRANDDRINKVSQRSSPAVLDGLQSSYDVNVYPSLVSPIPIIRNEELILLYAEANIGTNNNEAANALNIIRNAHGLPDYSGDLTDSELIDELLYNRRYSLFGEAHRWIDMRRFDRLSSLPIDRAGDDVWVQFPRPAAEQ